MYLFTAKAQRAQRFNYLKKKCSFILCRPSCPPVFWEDQRQRIRKNISASFASAVKTIKYRVTPRQGDAPAVIVLLDLICGQPFKQPQ
jgi:hypothetical protein